MLVVLIGLVLPIFPVIVYKKYRKEVSVGELAAGYLGFGILLLVLLSLVMTLFGDGTTSFWVKANASAGYAVKAIVMELLITAAITCFEWFAFGKHEMLCNIVQKWDGAKGVWFLRKIVGPVLFYLLIAAVLLLNLLHVFDNTLWGDEAFSATTVRENLKGILEIVRYWDSHPPFYYIWLKFWVSLFGNHGWVLHLASWIPFAIGMIFAGTVFQKKFGKMPTTFFVILSGLSAPCVEYNVEIRMYALAFWAILMAVYCMYRIMCGGKAAWFGLVIWALVAAYSHYYGLVIGGILIFITGVAYAIKVGGKGWIKSVAALIAFIVGYAPWLRILLGHTGSVGNNWWNSDILPLNDSLSMIGAGPVLYKPVLGFMLLFMVILLVKESGLLCVSSEGGQRRIFFKAPKLKGWSEETYAGAVAWLTIIGTLVAAYFLCYVVNPILTRRYLYMLIAVSAMILVMTSSRITGVLEEFGSDAGNETDNKSACKTDCKIAGILWRLLLLTILTVLHIKGAQDYRQVDFAAAQEQKATEQTLDIIGAPESDVIFVSAGVKHMGWTILKYYYPDYEIYDVPYEYMTMHKFWYLTYDEISSEEISELEEQGIVVEDYGMQQISHYTFRLYYFGH